MEPLFLDASDINWARGSDNAHSSSYTETKGYKYKWRAKESLVLSKGYRNGHEQSCSLLEHLYYLIGNRNKKEGW